MRRYVDILCVFSSVYGGQSVKLLSFQTLDRKHGPGLTVIHAPGLCFSKMYDIVYNLQK